jgi:excisionase family DNA binding protein
MGNTTAVRRPKTGSAGAGPTRKDIPELIDIEAVAGRLGVGVRHVRRLVAERRIPYIKWGHLVRFDPVEVAAWVERSRVAEW